MLRVGFDWKMGCALTRNTRVLMTLLDNCSMHAMLVREVACPSHTCAFILLNISLMYGKV